MTFYPPYLVLTATFHDTIKDYNLRHT